MATARRCLRDQPTFVTFVGHSFVARMRARPCGANPVKGAKLRFIGRGGSTICQDSAELLEECDRVRVPKGAKHVAVIILGDNDIVPRYSPAIEPAVLARTLYDLAGEVKRRLEGCNSVFVCPMFPRYGYRHRGYNSKAEELNKLLFEMMGIYGATARPLPWGLIKLPIPYVSVDEAVPGELFLPDGVHLSTSGYRALFQAVEENIPRIRWNRHAR